MTEIHFYIPITSQPRELDAKLLLALFARERGMKPILGYKSAFHARIGSLPPGLFLAHNARQKSEKTRRLRQFGHRVLVLDEEALVRQSDEIFLKKHPSDAFDYVDQVYTWGRDDFELWERSGLAIRSGVFVTGNPRTDTMRPELRPLHADKVADIKARYGDYVLLNTNFPTVNNLTPQGGGVRLAKWALDEGGKAIEQSFLANKRALYESFLDMAPQLARAIAPTNLVIRPHPNEDHAPWHAVAKDCPNAHVVFEGAVVPWLIGARALVHNGCTTGVEAAIMGLPTLNFRPWSSPWDNELSMAFGRDCGNPDELNAAVRDVLEGRAAGMSDAQRTLLERHVAHIDGEFSCERIVDLAIRAYEDPRTTRASGLDRLKTVLGLNAVRLGRLWKLYTSEAGGEKRRFLKENFPAIKPHGLDFEILGYSEQQLRLFMRQFPPLNTDELDARIARMARGTGRFAGLRARIVADNMFTVA